MNAPYFILSQDLCFSLHNITYLNDFIAHQYSWIWLIWLLSQQSVSVAIKYIKLMYVFDHSLIPNAIWRQVNMDFTWKDQNDCPFEKKDKAKIRAKKRWSQVNHGKWRSYLEDIPAVSENTYIVALDGDIDFQPHAVHLLVDYMKKNKTLGAACGREFILLVREL
ncbi:hypothetical protein NQ317_019735 [Molorchus minor]|uniref:Chitin synthase n=1 Tax=Molorchus minor TaxID=1323400 RepID=A0ABQ9IU63_9CUCU|nr:hypothetical protein NQ317_019735 [Molorchus minor]